MHKNVFVLKLTPTAKELLTKMHFPEIPEEAEFIAFLEDGNATFMQESHFGLDTLKTFTIFAHDNLELDIAF